ncbi:hypothetical protein ACTQ4E_06455 [Lawsonibacter sp. LCP25S3_G6]|uniref:hypothetical protein n=1 Tax=unclassified Lawsonibacter TaxID=2617946 RepID=UPI003F962622
MEYWSWRLFAILLALQIVRWIRRDGVRNVLRSMRLWGEGVSVEQRRENLAGLGILLVLLLLGVLFGLAD